MRVDYVIKRYMNLFEQIKKTRLLTVVVSKSLRMYQKCTGSVVRLVGKLSYLHCLQEMYCCVLDCVQ